jgi:hypothetical protein
MATARKKPARKKPTRKKAVRKKKQRGRGRPRIEFDLGQIEGLGAIMATQDEMACVLGCSIDTIKDRKAKDEEFSAALKRGQGMAKISLRRKQWELAERGNTTLLIWLGKQWLEQRDRQDIVTWVDIERFQAKVEQAALGLMERLRNGMELDDAQRLFAEDIEQLEQGAGVGGAEDASSKPN